MIDTLHVLISFIRLEATTTIAPRQSCDKKRENKPLSMMIDMSNVKCAKENILFLRHAISFRPWWRLGTIFL